jgi:threonine/homoserine/homoserine lactone efflux protein
MTILLNGILFGLLLSFLIGPAFFILIETSISKGFKTAFFFDLGILFSDAIYLVASFFVAKEINTWLIENPYIKYIAGGAFFIMGGVTFYKNFIKKTETNFNQHKIEGEDLPSPFASIIKGVGLNAINPGVLIYWIAACTYATEELKIEGIYLLYYFSATLLTMLLVDLGKIHFASKLKKRMTPKNIRSIGMGVGVALITFGIAICLKDINV